MGLGYLAVVCPLHVHDGRGCREQADEQHDDVTRSPTTLRIVQLTTMLGDPGGDVSCAVAEKQLYSSHYFETALELSFCARDQQNRKHPGFYLIVAMGSEQAGLTGVKGSILRKTAVSRSVSNLLNALTTIRDTLEATN